MIWKVEMKNHNYDIKSYNYAMKGWNSGLKIHYHAKKSKLGQKVESWHENQN